MYIVGYVWVYYIHLLSFEILSYHNFETVSELYTHSDTITKSCGSCKARELSTLISFFIIVSILMRVQTVTYKFPGRHRKVIRQWLRRLRGVGWWSYYRCSHGSKEIEETRNRRRNQVTDEEPLHIHNHCKYTDKYLRKQQKRDVLRGWYRRSYSRWILLPTKQVSNEEYLENIRSSVPRETSTIQATYKPPRMFS